MKSSEKAKLKNEIAELEKVTREKVGVEIYAETQALIGMKYDSMGDYDKAIEFWLNIRREDDSELYAEAQINIGLIYYEKQENNKAIEFWLNIRREDDSELYAEAQINIGLTYYDYYQKKRAKEEEDKKNYIDKEQNLNRAINAWLNIRFEDNGEIYIDAQSYLARAYYILGQYEEAIKLWKSLPLQDDKVWFDIGYAYLKKVKCPSSQRCFSNEECPSDTKILKKYIKNANYCFRKALEMDNYNSKYILYVKITEYFKKNECEVFFVNKLTHLERVVRDIRATIVLDLHHEEGFEKKLAHYTKVDVANILCGFDKNEDEKGMLRLNGIYNVNDPSEGNVLLEYLSPKLSFDSEYYNVQHTPFIACFTMDHDNLNQFRLYGKKDGKEATGVSIVVDGDFFKSSKSYFHSSNILNKVEIGLEREFESVSGESNKDSFDDVDKMPVYRCIYIDPKTGYINLAARRKITFFREYAKDGMSESKMGKKWQEYRKYIDKKERVVRGKLGEAKCIIGELLDKYEESRYDFFTYQQVIELIELILLEIQYLVKHSAFEEEQECRISYITDIADKQIHTDINDSCMYINYQPPVINYIKEICLAEGAKQYYPYFANNLRKANSEIKVHVSKNPFRTT